MADGKVEQGNTGLVTGDTVYQATDKLRGYMDGSINKLSKDIAQAGATTSALAALHPTGYDSDNKLEFAVGYGHYDGKNAGAIGAFYHPNENTMFSIGSTLTSGKKAFNAGLTFKVGSSSKKKAENATNKHVQELENKVDQLNALVNQLMNDKATKAPTPLKHERKGFKDVPADHWAAEAVETLHANGIVEGYPDGEFKGDKTMSRYEYAVMLYNQMNHR